jgi:hypothetical protein
MVNMLLEICRIIFKYKMFYYLSVVDYFVWCPPESVLLILI